VASQNLITDKAVLEFPQIYIVDQSTERLTGPFPSSDVLESLMDFATETIVVVQSRGGGGMFGEDGKSMPLLPVCRIYNREELQQREDELARQAEAKAAAERGRKLKIVEMSWSSDRKDSEVKLKRVQGFLERGHRVELVVYPKSVKKRQPPPTTTMEEMLELVGRVNGTVAGVVGAKEVKTRDGVVGGTLTFFIEGPSPLSKLHGRREDVPVEDVAAEEGAEEVPVQ
jgi:translation initiation factor IF-3